MLDTGLDAIALDDKTRVKIYYDTDQYDMEWVVGDGLGIYTIDTARGYKHINSGDRTEDLDRFMRNLSLDYRTDWREVKERALRLYLHLSGLNYKFVSLQGYSQGEWAEVVIYGDFDLTGAEQALLDWWRGDIYTVALERLHVYTEADTGQVIERWEVEDSIGCITLCDTYTVEDVIKDHFSHAIAA